MFCAGRTRRSRRGMSRQNAAVTSGSHMAGWPACRPSPQHSALVHTSVCALHAPSHTCPPHVQLHPRPACGAKTRAETRADDDGNEVLHLHVRRRERLQPAVRRRECCSRARSLSTRIRYRGNGCASSRVSQRSANSRPKKPVSETTGVPRPAIGASAAARINGPSRKHTHDRVALSERSGDEPRARM
jgi:hypothetical protein